MTEHGGEETRPNKVDKLVGRTRGLGVQKLVEATQVGPRGRGSAPERADARAAAVGKIHHLPLSICRGARVRLENALGMRGIEKLLLGNLI